MVMISRSCLRAKCFLQIVFFVIRVFEARQLSHAAQPDALNLSYSALVPSGAPFWITQEPQVVRKRRSQNTAALYQRRAACDGGNPGR